MGKHGEGLHEKEKEGIARNDHDYGSESRFGNLVHRSTMALMKQVGENVTNKFVYSIKTMLNKYRGLVGRLKDSPKNGRVESS